MPLIVFSLARMPLPYLPYSYPHPILMIFPQVCFDHHAWHFAQSVAIADRGRDGDHCLPPASSAPRADCVRRVDGQLDCRIHLCGTHLPQSFFWNASRRMQTYDRFLVCSGSFVSFTLYFYCHVFCSARRTSPRCMQSCLSRPLSFCSTATRKRRQWSTNDVDVFFCQSARRKRGVLFVCLFCLFPVAGSFS